MIPTFDIHLKVFRLGIGEDRIITPVYDIRTTLEYSPILKIILYKLPHPDTHLIIQLIIYGIQGITNKDTYRTILFLKKSKVINNNSIIPIYDVEERHVGKFT